MPSLPATEFVYEEFIPAGKKLAAALPGEVVVISGIAGQFPESGHIYELHDNLINMGDLITEDHRRWKKGTSSVPQRTGKIPHPEKFDAAAFGIDANSANYSDPLLRSQLESAVEAIMDAGLHPMSIRGKRVAVIVCGVFSETEHLVFGDSRKHNSFKVCNRAVQAGMIAHFLGVNGPTYLADSACSSSMYALDAAYQLIRTGKCESALVGGANFCLRRKCSYQFFNLGVLSADGRCRSFDDDGQGYVRSEAAGMVFLQKLKDAKRVYAHLIHTQTNCDGYKEQGITYPSGMMQEQLLRRFYKESGVDPNGIKYIEAHGTGTQAGDPEEMKAIENIFARKRTAQNPLLIGSVKSNLGHSEAVSGICSLAKVILSFESGVIHANINFKKPRKTIKPLVNGIIKVVTQHHLYPGGPIAINSFGFGGSNTHTLLTPNQKEKVNCGAPNDKMHRLVIASGRSAEAVNSILNKVETMIPVDAEYVGLLHEVYSKSIPGHLYRGFTILNEDLIKDRMIERYGLERKRKVYLLVSLSETNCNEVVIRSLMEFPVFSETMKMCSEILLQKGVDLLLLATSSSNDNQQVPHHCVTTSVQIGLLKMLEDLGVHLHSILGSSPAKDYADGNITLEDAIKVSYQMDLEEIQGKGNKPLMSQFENMLELSQKSGMRGSTDRKSNKNEELLSMLDGVIMLEVNPQRKLQCSINLLTDSHSILKELGKLYCCGIDLQLLNLYPRIEYPVSRGTPMISPFIKWDHSDDWFVAADINLDQLKQFDTVISIMMKKPENEYLYGHVVDGRNLYPATGYLMMVAETFCLDQSDDFQSDTVIFEDVKFIRATNIPKDGALTFNISYSPGNNRFEIVEGGSVIVTGYLRLDKSSKQLSEILDPPLPAEGVSMAQKDIYKELRLRGYNYSGLFRSFIGLDPTGCVGSIAWENNYVAYMDNMLQMIIFSKDTRNLYVPIQIERLTIDFKKHTEAVAKYNKQNALPVYCWKELALVCSGGIEIFGLNASPITRRRIIADPVLETYGFLPFQGHKTMTLDHLLQVAVHLALENGPCTNKIKVIEMPNDQKEELFSPRVVNILRDLPLLMADITVLLEPAPSEPPHGVLFESRDLKNESGCFMVLASGLLSSGNYKNVELVLATLANNGCIISKETTDFTTSKQKILADLGADIIMDWTLPAGTDRLIVAKKQQKSNSHEVKVVNLLCENYSWLPILQQLVKEKQKNVILVAQDDNCSGILGLINCIRKEVGGDQDVRCVFIMDPTAPKFDPNLKFYQDQLSLQLAVNVFYDGTWGSYRHLPIQEPSTLKVKHAFNTVTSSGDLSSFAWLQGPLDAIRDSEIDGFVHIYFSALNFRDVMIASGKLSPDVVYIQRQKQDCLQGFEFSGRDKHGRRVMGVARSGSMASAVIGIPDLQLEVPDYWTLEDAATVPVVYFTVILALKVTAKMQPGCSILIHAGSGGVGQAAINYCLFHGCTIFTTVGTTQKKEFIRKTFPQIPDTHIGNSRDTSFEQMIMEQTNGRGVDIVLNSLSEEKLQASVRSLASGGKFIEIGKFDLAIDNKLYAESFSKDKSFSAVMLDQLFHMGGKELIALSKLFSEALQEGSVKPLVRTVFGLNEVEQAYRYLAAGKHIGKVLVSIRPEENQVVCHPDELHLEARRRFYCNPYQTYIIVGGLGGFGLELTDWLILRQAKKIVLTSRTGITNGYQQSRLNTWKGYGVDVIISTEDISSDEGVCKLLEVAGKIGEVAGIFNLAVDLHDALLENQTPDSFQKSALPKAVATKLLDKWSRIMCPRLSQFVVFSSVSCGRGNVGQSNYGWSNSVMERICENRNRQNLPALGIQWGAIGEVGLVADMKDNDLDIVIGGTLPQRLTSCLSVMDDFLLQPHPVVASMVVAEKKTDFSKSAGILDYVTSILGIKDLKLVNPNATLAELGMDSMMAVEIKQTVETTFDVFLTAEDVRNISLASLESMADRSGTEEEKNTSQNNSSLKDTVKFEFSNQLSEILKWNVILQCEVQLMESLPGAKDIFLLPGMEGIAETFSQLSVKLLANSVKCLQTGFDNNQISSIQEVTNVFLPYVLNSLQGSGGTFTLLGHSYGGILALQLATLLEAHGYKGCIFLIDITPVSLYKYAPKFLGQDIGTLVLLRFLTYIGCNKIQIAEFQKQCHNITDWAQKLESALGIIKSSEIECSITARPLLTTICHRLTEMCNYVPSYKNIKSDIVLIKAKESQVVTEADVYEMQEISDNPVEIHEVDGTHFSVLESQELADIINYRLKV